jgi:uncharacterized protein
MEPTYSSECSLSPECCRTLLDAAHASIEHGVRTGEVLRVSVDAYPPELRAVRATFVTVRRNGQLLGCIGSLVATRPMIEDVVKNAYAAIFYDPRCPRLTLSDVAHVDVHISLLSEPEPMHFESEEDLLRQIRPGVDGLILEDAFSRGTFLPAVWETLPDPRDFLMHLKMKAGLPPTYWSDTLRVQRYTAESIS